MKLNFKELRKVYNKTPDSEVRDFINLKEVDGIKLLYVIVEKFKITNWDELQKEANELLPGNNFKIDFHQSSRGELVRFLDKVLSIIKSNSRVMENE